MMIQLRKILASSAGDIFVLIFALFVVYTSFSAPEPEAYTFPRLASVLLLFFCVINFVRVCLARFGGKAILTQQLLKKIAPGIVVIVLYLLLAKDVGFYLSAALAFFGLSFLYGKEQKIPTMIFITVAVIAVLYLVFSIALKVQVPREFFL